MPQIAGAGLTAPIAYRWKTQINENAKTPAFAGELPELDHNEIAGWAGAAELGRFSAVFLDDSDLHPRMRQRIELDPRADPGRAAADASGSRRSARPAGRLTSLVLLGDLVSVYLAVLRGVDPTPGGDDRPPQGRSGSRVNRVLNVPLERSGRHRGTLATWDVINIPG